MKTFLCEWVAIVTSVNNLSYCEDKKFIGEASTHIYFIYFILFHDSTMVRADTKLMIRSYNVLFAKI